jgi:Tol biopolymer transport system component
MAENGSEEPIRFHFADLTLDVGQRLVSRADNDLEVSGLTFDLLQAIVEAAPNVITADELAEKVWSGRPTSPETITQRAMMLRQALGDNAESPRYFEVVRGRGFRLIPAAKIAQLVENSPESRRSTPIYIAAAAVIVVAAVFYAGLQFNQHQSESIVENQPQVRRTQTELGDLNSLGPAGTAVELALSPDGTLLAYVINRPGEGNTLYLRPLDAFEALPMAEVINGRHPFFSEDGEWLFYEPNSVSIGKISIHGGAPIQIATGQHNRIYGSTRARNGDLIYATNHDVSNFLSGQLMRMPEGDGELSVVLETPEGMSFTWPHLLPDGNSLLFTSRLNNAPATRANISILSLDSGEHRVLLNGGYNARYSPTGHLLFGRDNDLWAVPFDADTLEITGDGQPVLYDIHGQSRLGQLIYDFSTDGHLVYARGGDASGSAQAVNEYVWFDESGHEERIDVDSMPMAGPRLSPDGSKIAMVVADNLGGWDIWIHDLERKITSKLTFDSVNDSGPKWSPDGSEIWFRSVRDSGVIHAKAADGTGEVKSLWKDGSLSVLEATSPDGRYFVLADTGIGESDMYLWDRNSEESAQPLIVTEFDEGSAEISPDGRFLAYMSTETGRPEVYVRPFPDVNAGKWQITSTGANEPRWSSDSSRLYFRQTNIGQISVTDIRTDPVFRNSKPRPAYVGSITNNGWPRYGISPVDGRLLVVRNMNSGGNAGDGNSGSVSLAFVENWFEELKRIQPSSVKQ